VIFKEDRKKIEGRNLFEMVFIHPARSLQRHLDMMPVGLNSFSEPWHRCCSYKSEAGILDDEGDLSPEDLSKLSHPERKKDKREKRGDVEGFDDLMNLLVEIDQSRIEVDERDRT
jgi:hypothetical protein